MASPRAPASNASSSGAGSGDALTTLSTYAAVSSCHKPARCNIPWLLRLTSTHATPRDRRDGPGELGGGLRADGDVCRAVHQQHVAFLELVDRLAVREPRSEACDCHHPGMTCHPERRPSTHRMADQDHREGSVGAQELLERPLRVQDGIGVRCVPASVAVPKQRHSGVTRAFVHRSGERAHAKEREAMGRHSPVARLSPSVQQQHDGLRGGGRGEVDQHRLALGGSLSHGSVSSHARAAVPERNRIH